MSVRSKIVVACIYLFTLFMWWDVIFSAHLARTEIIDVGPGNMSFTATMDAIRAIGPCNEKSQDQHYFDDGEYYWLFVEVTDEKGKPAGQLVSTTTKIHLNAYTSPESSLFDGLPAGLRKGEKYTLSYTCVNRNGQEIGDFSFRLYGDTKQTGSLTGIPFILAAIAGVIGLFGINKNSKPKVFIVVWITMLILNLGIMPAVESQEEKSAFADAYNLSSKLLGAVHTHDDAGNVYIQEDEIRNSENIHFLSPLITYWATVGNAKRNRTDNRISEYYRISETKGNLYQIPAGISVAIARKLRLPYQLVQASGWIINSLIVLWILLDARRKTKCMPSIQKYLTALFLLPSFFLGSMSYTAYGIWISLLIWLMISLADNHPNQYTRHEKIALVCVAVFEIQFLLSKVLNVILLEKSKFRIKQSVKTILYSIDEVINEMMAYDTFNYTKAFLSIFALLTIIVLLKWNSDIEMNTACGSKRLIMIRVGIMVCTLSMGIANTGAMLTNTINAPSGINGFVFLPLMLVPASNKRRLVNNTLNGNINQQVKYDEALLSIVILLSCIATIWKYSSL